MHLIFQFILTIAIVVLLPSFHSTFASFSLAASINSSFPISRVSVNWPIAKSLCVWAGKPVLPSLQVGLDLNSSSANSSISLSFLFTNDTGPSLRSTYEVPITDNAAIFEPAVPYWANTANVQVSLPRSTSPSVDLWRFNCSLLNLSSDASLILNSIIPDFYSQVVPAGTQSLELAQIATDLESVTHCCAATGPAVNMTIEYGGAMINAYSDKPTCLKLPFVSLSTPCRILASNSDTKDVVITSFTQNFDSVSPYTTTNPSTLPSSSPFVLSTTALILIIVFSIVGVIAVLSVLAFMWIKRRQFCPGLCRNSDLEASDASMIGPYSSVNNSTDH